MIRSRKRVAVDICFLPDDLRRDIGGLALVRPARRDETARIACTACVAFDGGVLWNLTPPLKRAVPCQPGGTRPTARTTGDSSLCARRPFLLKARSWPHRHPVDEPGETRTFSQAGQRTQGLRDGGRWCLVRSGEAGCSAGLALASLWRGGMSRLGPAGLPPQRASWARQPALWGGNRLSGAG